jgi:hypothetical protein
MSKTNDTTKTRELTEAELAAVSGAAIIVFDDEATPFRAGGTGKAGCDAHMTVPDIITKII